MKYANAVFIVCLYALSFLKIKEQGRITMMMNRISNPLYMFDCDGLLYAHTPKCYERMGDVGGKVIHAYTGIPHAEARAIGMQSWGEHQDGFYSLIPEFGEVAYHAMHRHFDMVSRLDVGGVKEPCSGMIRDLCDR